MTDPQTTEIALADEIEARAWRDMVEAAPIGLRHGLGLSAELHHGATCLFASALPVTMFNRTIGFGVDVAASEAALDEIVARYRAQNIGEFWLHLSDASSPLGLVSWLEARGAYIPSRRSWAKMLRGTEPTPKVETSFTVRELAPEDVEDATALADVICAAHGMPTVLVPWIENMAAHPHYRGYVACEGATVVSGAFLWQAGECAWLGLGGTLPTHRNRGAQGALMARRIDDAIAAGARHIGSETADPIGDEPSPSLANMRRCGFRKVSSRLNYALRTRSISA